MFVTTFSKRSLGIRLYHSIYHVNPAIVDLSKPENLLLEKAYTQYVPKHGFSNKSIELASSDMGLNSNTPNALFNFTTDSRNINMELILFHLKKSRQELQHLSLEGSEFDKLRILLHKRLQLNTPIARHLPAMLGTMILPSNVLQSLKELHNLSDDISYYAGDRSIDFAWYSKRMSISQLFVLSELFMVNDTSAGYQDTYKFVDNKLKEILTAGYIYNSVEEWTFFNAVSLVNIIKSQLARG